MKDSKSSNDEQKTLWNGVGARAWIEMQTLLDSILKPFADVLVQAAATKSPRRVLDVGCGTGATTRAVARRLGANSQVTGVDISEPMLGIAREFAAVEGSPATFICGDAQTYAFEPASIDLIISRFGVMFFENPVSAFTNLRTAATADAQLSLITWRGGEDNPFMTTAERAAAPLIPNIPPREPNAPGQFAFADPQKVRSILKDSGWTDIDIQPIDAPCVFPESELVSFFTHIGPLGRVLHEADEPTRAHIIATVRTAFNPYVEQGEVRFNAAGWGVSARLDSAAT